MQATTAAGVGPAPTDVEHAVVDALYEITVATRRLSDLAELAGLDVSTVSRHARDLAAEGFVLRAPDVHDRRAVTLQLAAEGRDVLADARTNRAAAMTPVLAAWTGSDRDELTRLLAALARDLTAASGTAPDRPTTDLEDSA